MYNLLILAGAIASVRAFIDLPKNFVDSNCSDAEFFCTNFECVPLIKQCDGSRDCSDGSDENDCGKILFNYSLPFSTLIFRNVPL